MLAGDEQSVGLALHVRYLNGDPTAREEIFLRYHDDLVATLRGLIARRRLYLPADDIGLLAEEAALQALASYLMRPEQYQPARGKSLGGYLRMSARGDFQNAFRVAVARQRTIALGLDDEAWKRITDGEVPTEAVEQAVDLAALRERFADVAETPDERTVLALMLDGERSNDVVAHALGWPAPADREQRARINRIKDRLNKRISRRFLAR